MTMTTTIIQKARMIFRNLDALNQDPGAFLLFMVLILTALVASFTVHEFSHALVATALGDDTAKRQGRLSLNPKVHLDPTGSLMILLAGFGWGKPVPVNPRAFGVNALRSMMFVAAAGPASNFLLAFAILLLFKIGLVEPPLMLGDFRLLPWDSPISVLIGQFFAIALFLNVVLGVFNLIPLAPLDGSNVALGLLPRNLAMAYMRLQPSGPGILMGIIMLDIFANTGIIAGIINVPIGILERLIL
jgi:Zn-dependent protease